MTMKNLMMSKKNQNKKIIIEVFIILIETRATSVPFIRKRNNHFKSILMKAVFFKKKIQLANAFCDIKQNFIL